MAVKALYNNKEPFKGKCEKMISMSMKYFIAAKFYIQNMYK